MNVSYFRIIGNDLPPRHEEGQSLRNLKYQLEHEKEFDDCHKIWVVNRILDPDTRNAIIDCLADRTYYEIDINPEVYAAQKTFEDKYAYLTNVNAARNFCLRLGRGYGSDIVLPFDGNCFFTEEAYFYFRNAVANNFNSPYFIVPMARLADYSQLTELPQIKEMYTVGKMKRHDLTEPQIAFGSDYDLGFNESYRYSVASKVELLWKLAIPGIWDYWYPDLHAEAMKCPSIHISRNPIYAGYVYRLPSGNPASELDNVVRGQDRNMGLKNLVRKADTLLL